MPDKDIFAVEVKVSINDREKALAFLEEHGKWEVTPDISDVDLAKTVVHCMINAAVWGSTPTGLINEG